MKNVLLVFGGVSYEHDISIVTAFQIFKKTKINDVKLNLFYVSRDGKFYLCDEKKVDILDFSKNNFSARKKGFKEIVFVSGENNKLFVKTMFGLREYMFADVAIFACHGGNGENGKLATLFESVNIACSAGRSEALSICMDKFLFKSFAKGIRIPVVPGFKISKFDAEMNKEIIDRKLARIGFPVVIKINSGGSSIGLFVSKNEEEFKDDLKEAFEFNDDVLVEKFIEGAREFNVAILGDCEKYEISEIDEPIKNNEVLTFADKYLSDGASGLKGKKGSMDSSVRKSPNDLSEIITSKIKLIAEKLFVKLGLFGVVRIDFLFDERLSKVYVCEVNAIPGSLAYYFFKKNFIVRNDLVEKLIKIAEKNHNKCMINSEFMVDLLDKK